VRDDNERGKGDHRHVGGVESVHEFVSIEKLLDDVERDAEAWSPPDLHLSFVSARSLFSELTPARVELLDTLRRAGPCSVYALARAAGRNYSNVHADVGRLEELGLIERTDGDAVCVPYDSVEILVPLAQVA
jgi:predicted transcriptional regulator